MSRRDHGADARTRAARPGAAPVARRGASPLASRGASLIVALLFLVILTLLGVAVMRATTVEVRIVGQESDRNLAFEAAEAALRDAERDIVLNDLNAGSPWAVDCAAGLCRPSTSGTPVWRPPFDFTNAAFTREYGAASGGGAYPVQPGQRAPRYLIELLPDLPPTPGSSSSLASRASTTGGTAFRITAVGWGRSTDTVQALQSVFVKQ